MGENLKIDAVIAVDSCATVIKNNWGAVSRRVTDCPDEFTQACELQRVCFVHKLMCAHLSEWDQSRSNVAMVG